MSLFSILVAFFGFIDDLVGAVYELIRAWDGLKSLPIFLFSVFFWAVGLTPIHPVVLVCVALAFVHIFNASIHSGTMPIEKFKAFVCCCCLVVTVAAISSLLAVLDGRAKIAAHAALYSDHTPPYSPSPAAIPGLDEPFRSEPDRLNDLADQVSAAFARGSRAHLIWLDITVPIEVAAETVWRGVRNAWSAETGWVEWFVEERPITKWVASLRATPEEDGGVAGVEEMVKMEEVVEKGWVEEVAAEEETAGGVEAVEEVVEVVEVEVQTGEEEKERPEGLLPLCGCCAQRHAGTTFARRASNEERKEQGVKCMH